MNTFDYDRNAFREFLFVGQLIAIIFFTYIPFNYIRLENDVESAQQMRTRDMKIQWDWYLMF